MNVWRRQITSIDRCEPLTNCRRFHYVWSLPRLCGMSQATPLPLPFEPPHSDSPSNHCFGWNEFHLLPQGVLWNATGNFTVTDNRYFTPGNTNLTFLVKGPGSMNNCGCARPINHRVAVAMLFAPPFCPSLRRAVNPSFSRSSSNNDKFYLALFVIVYPLSQTPLVRYNILLLH